MLARTMFIFWFGAYCKAFNCNESLKNYVMHISIMLTIHIYDGLLKYLFSKEFCWLKHAHSVIFYLTNWTETDVADQASPHMRPIPLHDERETRSLSARRSRSTFSWPACTAPIMCTNSNRGKCETAGSKYWCYHYSRILQLRRWPALRPTMSWMKHHW